MQYMNILKLFCDFDRTYDLIKCYIKEKFSQKITDYLINDHSNTKITWDKMKNVEYLMS